MFKQTVAALAKLVVSTVSRHRTQQINDESVEDFVKGLSGTQREIELDRVVRFRDHDGLIDGYNHQNRRGVVGVLVGSEVSGVQREARGSPTTSPCTSRARRLAG